MTTVSPNRISETIAAAMSTPGQITHQIDPPNMSPTLSHQETLMRANH